MNGWGFPRFVAEKRAEANCGKNILPILLCIDCTASARKANSKNKWKASNMLIFKGEKPCAGAAHGSFRVSLLNIRITEVHFPPISGAQRNSL
jgi:hypothetical protein